MKAALQAIAVGALLPVVAATAEASCREEGNDVWCTVCAYQPPPGDHSVTCCVSVFQDGQCCDPIFVSCSTQAY